MKPSDHRRGITNVLRSLDLEGQHAGTLILDHFDQAVAKAQAEGHEACKDKVLKFLAQRNGHGAA